MQENQDAGTVPEKLAIDCITVGSNIGQILGRVSVVNYAEATIFDTFVYYPDPIVSTSMDLARAAMCREAILPHGGARPFADVQADLVNLLRGRIVIGHHIQRILTAISMDVPSQILLLRHQSVQPTPVHFDMTVRETEKYWMYRLYANCGPHQRPSLKELAWALVNFPYQEKRVSSLADAITTMKVYRMAETKIEKEQWDRLGFWLGK